MFRLLYLFVLLSVLVAVGCSSDGNEKRQAYLDADYYTRLEMPPDLTSPEDIKQMRVPQPSEEAKERFKRASEHVGNGGESNGTNPGIAVAPIFDGVRIKTDNGVIWLEIEADADKVWPQLDAFWNNEGIHIVRYEPLLGFVDTEAVSNYQPEEKAGFFAWIFNKSQADKVDSFRMRVERDDDDRRKTRVYVTHSGMERLATTDDTNCATCWVTQPGSEKLEREILKRFSIFIGMSQGKAEKLLDHDYRPYASRVKLSESPEGDSVIQIVGAVEKAWNRTLRAVDRLGIEIINTDLKSREIKILIGEPTEKNVGEEKDEIAKSSQPNQQFSVHSAGSGENRTFILKLVQQGNDVQLSIRQPDGEAATTVAEQLQKSLIFQLR